MSARAPRRAQGRGCGLTTGALVLLAAGFVLVLMLAVVRGLGSGQSDRPAITDIPVAEPVPWTGSQPETGIDVSFPQCSRTLRDLTDGYVIVGLDGGMPDRPNPCFARQWAFAERQAGVAVYVNTSDDGEGDAAALGRRNARADIARLQEFGIDPGTPVWLDVELTEVWNGSLARHREVIAEHLRVLAEAGYPVGVYSAPSLWREITGDARLDVPTWVGIGEAEAEAAQRTCESVSFGGVRPSIVQRIGRGSDGSALDRNLTCPGVDLTGLIRPTGSAS